MTDGRLSTEDVENIIVNVTIEDELRRPNVHKDAFATSTACCDLDP